MKIALITPAPPRTDLGHDVTGRRWQTTLQDLGHEVDLGYNYGEGEYIYEEEGDHDVLIALGAANSGPAIEFFDEFFPDKPLIVAATGRDAYRRLPSDTDVHYNLERADAIVCFEQQAAGELTGDFGDTLYIIPPSFGALEEDRKARQTEDGHQVPMADQPEAEANNFWVAVLAHLNDDNDPLRAAKAAAGLPDESRIFINHVGRAEASDWEQQARRESQENSRYDWRGEVPRSEALAVLGGSDLLVTSAALASGPNTIVEAIGMGTPPLVSDIPGHVGLLGEEYPGLFKPGDTEALTSMMRRVERDNRFRRELGQALLERQANFEPDEERARWSHLLETIQ